MTADSFTIAISPAVIDRRYSWTMKKTIAFAILCMIGAISIAAQTKAPDAERKRDSAQPQDAERKRDSAQPQDAERKRDSAQPQDAERKRDSAQPQEMMALIPAGKF